VPTVLSVGLGVVLFAGGLPPQIRNKREPEFLSGATLLYATTVPPTPSWALRHWQPVACHQPHNMRPATPSRNWAGKLLDVFLYVPCLQQTGERFDLAGPNTVTEYPSQMKMVTIAMHSIRGATGCPRE